MADFLQGPVRRRVEVPPPETSSATSSLLSIAVFVVVVAGLYLARQILIPVTLAVLLSFVLAPIANFLRSIRLGRVPSVLIAVLLAFGVVLALGGLIGTQIADLAEQAPRYQYTIERKIDAVRSFTVERVTAFVSRFAPRVQSQAPGQSGPKPSPGAPAPAPQGGERPPIPVEVHQPNPSPLELAERILIPVIEPISTFAIVFVVAIFVLLQREDLRDRLIRLFGSRDLHRTTIAMDEAAERLSRYFLAQIAVNAGFGIVVSVGLWIIGVPSPALWGVIGALFRFVPYVGAFLSAVPPLAVAAAVDPGWTMVAWTLALYLVVEPVTGQAIEPWAYGRSAGLSPISVVIAAIFWIWLWGPIGLLLSTPLTLCLVVLGRHVDRLAFLEILLGDAPPLTPVENFYQRMLAGDPDEAQDQADQLLKERPLSAYYDEVVLEGLRLATKDAERGVLGPAQLEKINYAVIALIQDLSAHADTSPVADGSPRRATPALSREAPPPKAEVDLPVASRERLPSSWQSETPILCIAGRGPVDGAASGMLAQLLAKHGLGARDIGNEAASRQNIGNLDGTGVAMVCVTSLAVGRTPAHLRYLLRRLRQRLPEVPILIGFPSRDGGAANDTRLREAIGADHFGSSLREAVKICLGAAGAADRRLPGADEEGEEEARGSAAA